MITEHPDDGEYVAFCKSLRESIYCSLSIPPGLIGEPCEGNYSSARHEHEIRERFRQRVQVGDDINGEID